MSGEETRARFLAAIGAQLPVERVQELHLFAPIRQGGMESGVAVIAVDLAPAPAAEGEPDAAAPSSVADEEVRVDDLDDLDDADDAAHDDREFLADDAFDAEPEVATRPVRATRYTVYTARYRHTLKGPDRGKWEISVTEEADAPLLTVDAVVRGVTRRSGEADETVRLSGDEFRAALPQPAAP